MKINSNLNENFNTPKKHPTFGVRKTDSIQSFINEIRTTNPNLGNIARLPIVQKMKENDTFEQLQEKANTDKSMFENKHSFNIANKKGFIYLINSICIKIMQELKTLGETVGKFIVQVEDENGNKKENDIVFAFKNRLRVKKHYNNHKDKIKEYRQNNSEKIKEYKKKYQKEYRQKNKEEINEYQKKYRQNNSEEIKEYQKKYQKEYQKEYRQNNSEKIKEYNKEYYLKKKENATLKKQEKEVREFLNELRNQKY